MQSRALRSLAILLAVTMAGAFTAACGSGGDAPAAAPAASSGAATSGAAAPAAAKTGANPSGLAPGELEKGIGPVKSLALAAIDDSLADQGEGVFKMKCAACHKMETRYVGPALGAVLTRRQPEYVMNMILNPLEMVQKHPEAKKLLAEYFTAMPDQGLSEAEARAVLEYLRTEQQAVGN